MDLSSFTHTVKHQSGVVSRRQLVQGGATDAHIRRWVRRRELRRVHDGVYVDHTGPLTWHNRAWAAVLYHWPAALTHRSCLERHGEVIHIAVEADRTPRSRDGVRVHRLVDLEGRVLWNVGPPRVRLEDALLSMCSESKDRVAALALLSDACRRRTTTPARLAAELATRPRITHRRWLLQVLQETADGVQSLLESGYRRNVERAHGLPVADRQRRERTEDGVIYRDATYRRYGLVVELDGRVGHELSGDRWDDQDRDLLSAGEGMLTVRLGWRHCETTPCRTAQRLVKVLRIRGWTGAPRACSTTCPLG